MGQCQWSKWNFGIYILVNPFFIQSIWSANDEEYFFLLITILMKSSSIYLLTHHTHHDFVPTSKVFFEYLNNSISIFLDGMCLWVSFTRFDYLNGQVFSKSFTIFITGRGEMFVAIGNGKDSKFHRYCIVDD